MEVEGVVSQHTRERIGTGYILESLRVEKNMKGGHSSWSSTSESRHPRGRGWWPGPPWGTPPRCWGAGFPQQKDMGEETLFLREVFEIRIDAKNDTLTVQKHPSWKHLGKGKIIRKNIIWTSWGWAVPSSEQLKLARNWLNDTMPACCTLLGFLS